MAAWELPTLLILGLAFVLLAGEFQLSELFQHRQDTRRIRSYLKRKEEYATWQNRLRRSQESSEGN
jgi:hypothetical protein